MGFRAAWIIGAGIVCGCARPAPPPGPVQPPVRVSSPQDVVQRGDSMSWTLTNGTDTTLVYNGCPQSLERRERAGWRRVFELPTQPVPNDGLQMDCAAMALILEAGASTRVWTRIPRPAPPGTYRLVFLWVPSDPRDRRGARLVSPTFVVR